MKMQTGFFFSQDLATGLSATGSYSTNNMQNLFKLVARNSGDYAARNLKVSISNIRTSADDTSDQPYGTFSVLIRKMNDTDNRLDIVEQFITVTSTQIQKTFIAKKIGDKFVEWDEEARKDTKSMVITRTSKYVYVSMPEEVRLGEPDMRDSYHLVLGGPIQFKSFDDTSSETTKDTLVSGNFGNFGATSAGGIFISGSDAVIVTEHLGYEFPQLALRVSASEGSPVDPLNSFFGVDSTFNTSRLDKSMKSHVKVKPADVNNFLAQQGTEISFNFTLDDICFEAGIAEGSTAKF